MQHRLGEFRRGHAGELLVEGKAAHEVEPHVAFLPQRLQHAHLDAEGGEAERRLVGPEEGARMRLERQNADRAVIGLRPLEGARDHRLVAEMHAVEVAERDGAAAAFGRDLVGMAE